MLSLGISVGGSLSPAGWPGCVNVSSRRLSVRAAGFGDGLFKKMGDFAREMVDYNSWAPRSAKAWRLNQYDYESSTSSTPGALRTACCSARPAVHALLNRESPCYHPFSSH